MAKILVIDDDDIVRTTIGRILRRSGYEVVFAADGRRGVQQFRNEGPDLIITDIIMPDQEGLETILEIRRIRPDAKIIAISGGGRLGNADFLTMAEKFGAREIIAKPFDPSQLTESVSRCLGADANAATVAVSAAKSVAGA
jgi:DNA-binding NtrC family response regulator